METSMESLGCPFRIRRDYSIPPVGRVACFGVEARLGAWGESRVRGLTYTPSDFYGGTAGFPRARDENPQAVATAYNPVVYFPNTYEKKGRIAALFQNSTNVASGGIS